MKVQKWAQKISPQELNVNIWIISLFSEIAQFIYFQQKTFSFAVIPRVAPTKIYFT